MLNPLEYNNCYLKYYWELVLEKIMNSVIGEIMN